MMYSGVLEKSSLTTESRKDGAERVRVSRGAAAESDARSSLRRPGKMLDDDGVHVASEFAVDGRAETLFIKALIEERSNTERVLT